MDFSNFDTSEVTDMGSMFSGCLSLKFLDLSNFNTSSVTNMMRMFYGCSSLESINLYNFDTSKVISMYSMFEECSSIKYLNLANFNTSKVNDFISMFEGCSSLEYLNLENFDSSNNAKVRDIILYTKEILVICSKNENFKNKIREYVDANGQSFNCTDAFNEDNKKICNSNQVKYNEQCIYDSCPQDTNEIQYNDERVCINFCSLETPFYLIEKNICFSNCNISDIINKKCILNYNSSMEYELENIQLKNVFYNIKNNILIPISKKEIINERKVNVSIIPLNDLIEIDNYCPNSSGIYNNIPQDKYFYLLNIAIALPNSKKRSILKCIIILIIIQNT